jgi:hypothetical protein
MITEIETETETVASSPANGFVEVNYYAPAAIDRAIKTGNFNTVEVELSLGEIPLVGSGRVVRKTRIVPPFPAVPNSRLPEALRQYGKKLYPKEFLDLADPLTTILYAGKCTNPSFNWATVFPAIGGRLIVLHAYGRDGGRVLRMRQTYPDKSCGDVSFVCNVI